MAEAQISATRKPVSDAACRGRRRRAAGLTLLELGVVITLFGFLILLLIDQQTRILQDRASRARQDLVVANAVAILEAALNHNEDLGNWPTGPRQSVAALARITGGLGTYLPNAARITNPYAPRPGLDEDFFLEASGMTPQPTDPAMILSFQVWGESDARYVAGLLPFGTSAQVGTSDVYTITTQVVWAGLEQYIRADGSNAMRRLRFSTDRNIQDRTRPRGGGIQGIEDIDRITFDNNPVARTDANPNSILGADRVVHQVIETGDLTGFELENDEASLLLRQGIANTHRARFDLDAMNRGRLRVTQEVAGTTVEGVAIGLRDITVPNGNIAVPNGDITLGTGSDITIGAGGDVSVGGSVGLHERLCELEEQLETDSSGLASTLTSGGYAEDAACP